tara:strand:- start:892 stop:1566 length:675 start_codon:yes stop_codon:yes gene_type:complete
MKVAVHQPNYLPYLGFIDKAKKSDIFVIYDDAQFSKGDWHNRNKIRTPNGWAWLTIPVKKHPDKSKINEILINNDIWWHKKHLKSIDSFYSKTKNYNIYKERINSIYSKNFVRLIDLNMAIIDFFWDAFSIKSKLILSSNLNINSSSTSKLIDIMTSVGGDTYISGDGAEDYLEFDLFIKKGIEVELQNFTHPQYKQNFQGFEPNMSALDALFNIGPDINFKDV